MDPQLMGNGDTAGGREDKKPHKKSANRERGKRGKKKRGGRRGKKKKKGGRGGGVQFNTIYSVVGKKQTRAREGLGGAAIGDTGDKGERREGTESANNKFEATRKIDFRSGRKRGRGKKKKAGGGAFLCGGTQVDPVP